MKKREITATGRINNNGLLSMYMSEINDFFRQHKDSRVIARFIVSSPGSSMALKGYYYNAVVPSFKAAIWESGERKTEKDTELFLRQLSPIMYEEIADENGQYTQRIREISELSNSELIEHIETLKQIAAEEYNLYIEDPNII